MNWLNPRTWLAVAIATTFGATGGYFKGHAAADQSAKLASQIQTVNKLTAERDTLRRRTQQLQENAEDAQKKRDQARADAIAASATAASLRHRVASLGERARHTCTSDRSTTTSSPIDLFTELLGRAGDRAAELAEYADRARIAGQQCERSYRTMSTSQ